MNAEQSPGTGIGTARIVSGKKTLSQVVHVIPAQNFCLNVETAEHVINNNDFICS